MHRDTGTLSSAIPAWPGAIPADGTRGAAEGPSSCCHPGARCSWGISALTGKRNEGLLRSCQHLRIQAALPLGTRERSSLPGRELELSAELGVSQPGSSSRAVLTSDGSVGGADGFRGSSWGQVPFLDVWETRTLPSPPSSSSFPAAFHFIAISPHLETPFWEMSFFHRPPAHPSCCLLLAFSSLCCRKQLVHDFPCLLGHIRYPQG